jgi:hypothetical protein
MRKEEKKELLISILPGNHTAIPVHIMLESIKGLGWMSYKVYYT